jgi:hypothetical protein
MGARSGQRNAKLHVREECKRNRVKVKRAAKFEDKTDEGKSAEYCRNAGEKRKRTPRRREREILLEEGWKI